MASKNDELLEQADGLWKMLDDLAETDPGGYKKLMDNVIKEQKGHWKPPEPVFSFRTLKLPEPSKHHVFINICKWDQVSKPKDGDTKISVVASNLRDLPDYSSKHSAIDICFHNDIIHERGKNHAQCQKLLASLALDYIEKQCDMKLSKAYKVLSIKYKGDIEELKRFLFCRPFMNRPSKKPVDQDPSQDEGGLVLDGLSKIVQNGKQSKLNGIPQDFKGLASESLLGKQDEQNSKKPLIEEVSTSKHTMPLAYNVPESSIEIIESTSRKSSKHIKIKVKLPQIQSGAECELEVSKEDLVLCSTKYSKLHLQLPQEGNEDETTSIFNKTNHVLTVIIPVAKP